MDKDTTAQHSAASVMDEVKKAHNENIKWKMTLNRDEKAMPALAQRRDSDSVKCGKKGPIAYLASARSCWCTSACEVVHVTARIGVAQRRTGLVYIAFYR